MVYAETKIAQISNIKLQVNVVKSYKNVLLMEKIALKNRTALLMMNPSATLQMELKDHANGLKESVNH